MAMITVCISHHHGPDRSGERIFVSEWIQVSAILVEWRVFFFLLEVHIAHMVIDSRVVVIILKAFYHEAEEEICTHISLRAAAGISQRLDVTPFKRTRILLPLKKEATNAIVCVEAPFLASALRQCWWLILLNAFA